MKIRSALVVTIGFALVGCGSLYVPPTSGDVATLTVRNNTRGKVLPATFTDQKTCKGQRNLLKGISDPALQPQQSVTVAVLGEREFSLSVFSQQAGGLYQQIVCSVVGTFVPKTKNNYVATIRASATHCVLTVDQEVVDANGRKATISEPTLRLRETQSILAGQGLCKAE